MARGQWTLENPRTMRRRATLVGAVTLVLACSVPPPRGPEAAGAGKDNYLVFAAAQDGKTRTSWIVADDGPAGYREIAARGELVVAAGEHVFGWRTRKVLANQCDCQCLENAGGDQLAQGSPQVALCERPVDVQVDELVDLTGQTSSFALPDGKPLDLDSKCEMGEDSENQSQEECRAAPLGAVGPFLFVFDSCYGYYCGAAHGQMGAGFRVVDLRDRRIVPVLSAEEAASFARQALPAALAAFRAEGTSDDGDYVYAPDTAELTLQAPRFAADGTLVLDLQFTADASYAESDGRWSSYSRSVSVPAPTLPARLAPLTTPPPVARWMAAHVAKAPSTVRGWSRVEAAALAAFRAP